MHWLVLTLALALTLWNGVAVVLTLIGLPGTWLMLAGALVARLAVDQWAPAAEPMFGWWTLGVAGLLCIGAELAEGLSGAAGAKASKSSMRAAGGAIVGGIAGAIVGTVALPVPVVGTIVGAAIGAGAGAMALELTVEKELRTSTSIFDVGRGAAIGRLLATIIKTAFAVIIALQLTIAGFA